MSKTSQIMKNVLLGILSTVIHIISKIIIPIMIFASLIDFSIGEIEIGYTKERVDIIIYYILAFGYLSAALAFFKGSSPKHSIRKPIGEFLFEFVSICYLYTYRLSGALAFTNIVVPVGEGITTSFSLNLDVMIYVSMAIISLKMVIAIIDIFRAIFFPPPLKKEPKKKSNFDDEISQFEEEITK